MAKKETKEVALVHMQDTVSTVLTMMSTVKVKTDKDYEEVAVFCKKCKETQKIVKDFFKKDLDAAKEALEAIKDEQDKYLKRLQEAESIAKAKMSDFVKLREEQQRIAEEKERLKAEAKRQKELEALREAGKNKEAKALAVQELEVKEVQKEAPKLAGISYREIWTVEEIDLPVLLRAISAGKAPLEAIVANTAFLGALAREKKQEGEILPGVFSIVSKVPVVR